MVWCESEAQNQICEQCEPTNKYLLDMKSAFFMFGTYIHFWCLRPTTTSLTPSYPAISNHHASPNLSSYLDIKNMSIWSMLL